MEILQTQKDDVVLVELLGRLDELAAGEVENAFRVLLGGHAMKVILDLSNVDYVSSGGLCVLLKLLRGVKQKEGLLKLCGLSPFVAEVFAISNFQRFFDVCADREAAWAALSRGPMQDG